MTVSVSEEIIKFSPGMQQERIFISPNDSAFRIKVRNFQYGFRFKPAAKQQACQGNYQGTRVNSNLLFQKLPAGAVRLER
jgi:hypothetical protein